VDYPVLSPPLPRPVLLDQRWTDVTFMHWAVDPDSIVDLYPPGTRPDVFEGATYVGLVPFAVRKTKLGTSLPLPYFGDFLEINVRLYSIDEAGRHGVLFCSLETARLAVVPVTRVGLGVPYTWARVRMAKRDNRITYESTRRWPRRGLRCKVTVTVGQPVEPSPLEVWLTARWGAHTQKVGRTWWVPNEHETWPLRAADVDDLDDDLIGASGARAIGPPLRALFSAGVHARFGRPQLVR
jgi:uncharacterized protein YqjF (DUF2071 family)